MKRTILTIGLLAALLIAGSAQATLINRGNGLIYDDVLNITWTQNANLCATLGNCDGFTTGQMFWENANAWAANLVYQGFSDWRLPRTFDNGCSGFNCTNSEMGHLFYTGLGGVGLGNLTGNQGPFTNIQSVYWSGTEFSSSVAWAFVFADGVQGTGDKGTGSNLAAFSWAVRDGDVAASAPVPEPGSLLLLGMGSAGLGLVRWWRRR